jgi:hypothetical protein
LSNDKESVLTVVSVRMVGWVQPMMPKLPKIRTREFLE